MKKEIQTYKLQDSEEIIIMFTNCVHVFAFTLENDR